VPSRRPPPNANPWSRSASFYLPSQSLADSRWFFAHISHGHGHAAPPTAAKSGVSVCMTCCLWAFEGAIIRVGIEDWHKSTRGALVAAAAAAPAEEAEAERQCDCDAARNQRHQPRLSVIGIGGEEA